VTGPFDGRVALVTGAGRRIGRAVAIQLAEGGVQVALLARSVDQLEETAATIRANGGSAAVIPADLTEPEAVVDAATRVAKEAGPVDFLINNAGVVEPAGSTVGTDRDAWNRAFAVNVDAPVQLTLTFLPSMLERRWGCIVNISTGIVERPWGHGRAQRLRRHESCARSAHTEPGGRTGGKHGDGAALHHHFQSSYEQGALITPEQSARALIARLADSGTGEIWTADGHNRFRNERKLA
jgi:NAD(P)-dependent dehydrogenase (short-subunit alcohol dehydrogenase family)